MKPQKILQKALNAHKSGKLDAAENGYRKAVKLLPNHPDAWHLYGVIALDKNLPEIACKRINRAIRLNDKKSVFHLNLGLALAKQEYYLQALESYKKAIELQPDYTLAYNHCGVAHRSIGDLEAALNAFNQALEISPNNTTVMYNKGLVLKDTDQLENAISLWRRALEYQTVSIPILKSLTKALIKQSRFREAALYLNNLLDIEPQKPESHYELGEIYYNLEEFIKCEASLSRAIQINPDYCAAWSLLGKINLLQRKPSKALQPLETALSQKPDSISINYDYGYALLQLGESEKACNIFRKLLDSHTNLPGVYDSLLMALSYTPGISAATLYAEHLQWANQFKAPNQIPPSLVSFKENSLPLNIGYVSADFGQHAVANMLVDTLTVHNSDKFKIHYYSERKKEDPTTLKFKENAYKWHSTGSMDDASLLNTIQKDEIDILVDLSGHTSGNRLSLFAQKAAPIQASWIGYCDTTGLDAIDYILMDPITAPTELNPFFSERVVRFPATRFCYSPPDYSPAVSLPPCASNGYITFGSFNNLLKVTPKVIELWSKVLTDVKKSRMIIFWNTLVHPPLAEKIHSSFADHGITRDRVILKHDHESHEKMLEQYSNVDICLDTSPYTGGITTSEALWMGVPVVTLSGIRAVSRQSASIINACGFSDWIASNGPEYIFIATQLAKKPEQLIAYRATQRVKMLQSDFMNYNKQISILERFYRSWWEQAGK